MKNNEKRKMIIIAVVVLIISLIIGISIGKFLYNVVY